jgi:hypothetical protein
MQLPQPLRAVFLVLALPLCVLFSQTQSVRPRTATTSTPSKAAPKPSDQQLEAKIRAKFAGSKSANTFKVHVQGGVAIIEGRTDVVQHKAAATRMAKTAGAVAVNNKVEISDAAKKKAAANLEEGRRRVQVKRSDARDQGR